MELSLYKYLKEHQYYIDRYDLYTIKECLLYYNGIKANLKKGRNNLELKKLNDKEFLKEVNKTASYVVNIIKTKRYKHKKRVVQEWMERDRKIQERFDNAVPPEEILCKKCFFPTKVLLKDLRNPYEKNSKILFLFECLKCKKRQALYEDGTEWKLKKQKCPKCNNSLDEKSKYTKDILTTFYSCPMISANQKKSKKKGKLGKRSFFLNIEKNSV